VGSDTIDSVSFSYGDLSAGGSYSWVGTLPPASSFIDTMPAYAPDQGPHQLMINEGMTNMLLINGSFDAEPYNNLLYDTLMQDFYVWYTINSTNPFPMSIAIQPDAGGMQADFEAIPNFSLNGSGLGTENYVYHSSQNNSILVVQHEMCLNDDCFNVNVSVNQGAGWATLISDAGDTIFNGYLDGIQQNPIGTVCNGTSFLNGNGSSNSSNPLIPIYSLLYPNPTDGSITVSSRSGNLTQGHVYHILSVDGRRVARGKVDNGNSDVSHLSKGVYLVRIIDLETNTIQEELKFVKK
jgi:hypothetical protein